MQKTGLNRDTIDKFYTKQSVATECVIIAREKLLIEPTKDIIIEPSAGNGSFITEIKNTCQNTIFYDIEPEHCEIVKQDYLTIDLKEIEMPDLYTKIHIMGNPPFGRQSSIAIKFIKKSAEVADSISFILPKSFKKDSMRRHFPINFHLIYEKDIETKSFIQDDAVIDVPCVFQIWQRQDNERFIKPKETELKNIYKFVNKDEMPDISIRRVGGTAGKIDDTNIETKNIQSHYFIKFDPSVNKKNIIDKLKNISYTENNTVGPKSISKQEFIREFNKILQ